MTEKIPCSVGILTKNSAGSLERALESVKDFAEILVCDGGSTDTTLDIAARYGARVMPQKKEFLDAQGYISDFSGVRNQTLNAASYDWYLYVDSDEYISPELAEEIRAIVSSRTGGAFNVFRRYVLGGREVECAASYPNRSMRFFSRRSSTGFRKIVHERPALRDGVVPEALTGTLFVPVDEDISKALKRNDRYIALEVKRKGRVGVFQFLGYTRWEMRSTLAYTVRLLRSYIVGRGTRMPLRIELARYRYPFKLLAALWRGRMAAYPPIVLFFTNKWKTGGAEHVFLQELQALRKEGIAVRFGAVYGTAAPPGVDARLCIFPRFKNLFDAGAYVRLISIVGSHGITHMFATLEHASIVARIAAVFLPRVRLVVCEPGMAERKPLRYKFLDLVLNVRTNAIVSVSRGVERSLLRYQSLHAGKMRVLHNGVPVPSEPPARSREPRFTVFAAGSLRHEKGFEFLLEAFKAFLEETDAEAELVLAGEGPLRARLEEKSNELDLERHMRFLGEISHDEVFARYRRADCFVLSSVSEGNPNVVLEALSQATPVIATAVSGVEDVLADGVSGIIVPPGSSRALCDALVRLYRDPALRAKLGQGGFERAKAFSSESHMRALKDILHITT